jgi:transglutaminase-like putative cysteine protease
MRFELNADLTYDFAAPCEVLLLLEAARSPDQSILSESLRISPPVDIARLDDSISGERRAVFEAQGRVEITYQAQVEVLRPAVDLRGAPASPIRELPGEALRYLRPSSYCPSDHFEAFVHREFWSLAGGDKVLAILAWIADNIDYQIGVSDSATTARDTFVDRAGVCRDFAHLAITLCRAAQIPARAVSAYAFKLDPPDMHAVAEVYLGGRWQLIDASGMAPVDGLVRVATGLDAADIAFMTIFGQAQLVAQSFGIRQAVGA